MHCPVVMNPYRRAALAVAVVAVSSCSVSQDQEVSIGRQNAEDNGGSLRVSHDIAASYSGADVVYAKSWGALAYFGNWEQEKPIRERYRHFMVDGEKMALTNHGVFSHCLPLRRNIKATDEVMDSPACIAIDEAENRLHVQKAVMAALMAHHT